MHGQGQQGGCQRFRSRSRSRDAFRRRPAQPAVLSTIVDVAEEPSSAQHLVANPLMMAAAELKFACQLAHGSPVAIIDRWSDVAELYQSIADCFGLQRDEIVYLTVNDFKPDMRSLFTGTLNFKDMLYAHVRGQATELTVLKDASCFGVTITDNGMGNAFVKVIAAGSVFDRMRPATAVGQLIESIDGECMLGRRHYQVARVLKSVRQGQQCVIRLISPRAAATAATGVAKASARRAELSMGTIRFKSEGGFAVEDVGDQMIRAEMCGKLNELFDQYLGVQDDQLATRIWETAAACESLWQLSEAIARSELAVFEFPDGLIFDMWGIIGDLKREQRNKKTPTVMRGSGHVARPSAMNLFTD